MKQYYVDNTLVLEPDEGKTLTNGESYSKQVFLGKSDNSSNWHEILDSDVPTEEDPTEEELAEAGRIMMGYEHN